MPTAESSDGMVHKELDKILSSAGFARNERLSGFLRFVVEQQLAGQGDQLKESVIAIEVFRRQPDYDPRQDSVVRTEAAKLRARLAEYYAGEGAADTVVIEMPKGRYAPLVRFEARRAQSPDRWRPNWLVALIATAAILLLGAIFYRMTRPAQEARTIAVLPLENHSPEAGSEYFADGLTDDLIQNLSAIEGIEVRSHTSSFTFKGKPHNIREVGQQLRVNFVVEGSLARSADRLRVNVQLVRTRDDTTLWNGRFERDVGGIFAIQDDISRAVVNQLRLKLGRGQRRYTTNVEVYDLYLQARQLLLRREFNDAQRRVDLFEQVIEKDSGFAPAYAGLAQAYAMLAPTSRYLGVPYSDANFKIKEYADKALQLDPLLPDAWVSRGLLLSHDYQWTEAEKAFHRAIELSPSLSDAHEYYGAQVLFKIGRHEDGLREVRRAVELDPLAAGSLTVLSFLLVTAGHTDEAWKMLSRLRSLDPDQTMNHQFQGRLLLQKGQAMAAIPYFQRGVGGGLGDPFLGFAYGVTGKWAEAESLRESQRQHQNNGLALTCAGLGDRDCVFEALNQMADMKDPRIHYYIAYPELSLIRGDPRLLALKKKIGL
jgi:TolB-like protein